MIPLTRYQGGARAQWAGGAVAAAGLALTAVGFAVDPGETMWAWLFAYVLWMGLAVGALLLLGTLHATRARWSVPLRRVLEAMALSSVLLVPLFVPLAFGLDALYPWHTPPQDLSARHLEQLHHKLAYLNTGFFLARAAAYLVVWAVIATLLDRWSRRQDHRPDPRYVEWQHRLGSAALVAVGLTLSFAVVDWVMSIDPFWISTVFSLYFFSGSFLGALALLCLVAVGGQRGSLFLGLLRPSHFHTLGKLLLALVVFWAYVAFAQYMLVWIANEPEELPWVLDRTSGGWGYVALFLPVGHFALPFLLLLSRQLKLAARALAAVAGWVLLAHAVDVYWMILPTHHPGHPAPHWTQLTALAGMGGAFVAFVAWRLRGGYALPVGDPELLLSLHYQRE